MAKIFNSFSGPNPIATVLGDLGKQMFGNNTANAINSEKLYAAQRQNTETDNLMGMAAKMGVHSMAADPVAQALLIGSGYKPSDFGDIGLMGAATEFGAADPRTQNWQVGTGQSYDNTAGAFGSKLAETARNNDMASSDRRYGVDQSVGQQRYEFDNKPMDVLGPDGTPTFGPQGSLVGSGMQPILSDADRKGTLAGANFGNMGALPAAEQNYLGANGGTKTPRNYITPDGQSFITYDGVTAAQTGQPLPPGGAIGSLEGGAGDVGLTNSTQSGVQQNILSNNKFTNLLALTREAAQQDPTNFGVPGFVKGMAQDLTQIAQGMAQGFGYRDAEEYINTARNDAAAAGIDPGLLSGIFDPGLSEVQTLGDLMVYSAAEALAGQSGRSVSDKDVQFFKGIVGDPQSWLMSQEKFLAKLAQLERIVQSNQGVLSAAQQQGAVPMGSPQAPAAPAAPQGGPVRRKYNPATGQLE